MSVFEAFITHVESVGPLLKFWVQLNRNDAVSVERLILQVKDKFEKQVSTPKIIQIGTVCCAKYSDGCYYRARITNTLPLEKVIVHFIDYGNTETVAVSDIRTLNERELQPLVQLTGQATEFFLAGLLSPRGSWDDSSLTYIKQLVCYEVLKCLMVRVVNDKKLIRIEYQNKDLAAIIIEKNIGVEDSFNAQERLIQGYFSLSSVSPLSELLLTPPPTQQVQPQFNYPILPAVRVMNTPQQMVVPVIQPPIRESINIFTSPKLEIHSEHMVYVSCVEDGPSAFTVQLQVTEDLLSSLMNEINSSSPIPFTQPLMPGSVCLGRFTDGKTLCRAVVSEVLYDKCKLYYVDFGASEILPYSEIYELPQKFFNVKVMAIRFALSGLTNLDINNELKSYFINLVTEKLLCLKVTLPEGPPLKQYCELYLEGRSIYQLLLEKKKMELQQPVFLDYQPYATLSAGRKEVVKVSYVDHLSNFYVQLLINREALNSVMLAVDSTCTSTSRQLRENELRPGLPCCSLYREDEKWYRAKVLSVVSDLIEVLYVDYGNTDKISLSSLKCIEPDLVNILKPQAIPCCLSGYENNVNDELSIQFEKDTLEKTLTMVVVGSLENGKLLVDLYDSATGKRINIGDGEKISQATEIQQTTGSDGKSF